MPINLGDILGGINDILDIVERGGKVIGGPGAGPGTGPIGGPLPGSGTTIQPADFQFEDKQQAENVLQWHNFLLALIKKINATGNAAVAGLTAGVVTIIRNIAGSSAWPPATRQLAQQVLNAIQGAANPPPFPGGDTLGPPLPPGGNGSLPAMPGTGFGDLGILNQYMVPVSMPLQTTVVARRVPGMRAVTLPNGQRLHVKSEVARALKLVKPTHKPLLTAGDMKALKRAERLEKKLIGLTRKHTDYSVVSKTSQLRSKYRMTAKK